MLIDFHTDHSYKTVETLYNIILAIPIIVAVFVVLRYTYWKYNINNSENNTKQHGFKLPKVKAQSKSELTAMDSNSFRERSDKKE